MSRFSQQLKEDPTEATLKFLEKENAEFKSHWVWKTLQCTPEILFKAVQKHIAGMQIPSDEWKQALIKAKEECRIRSLERRRVDQNRALHLIGGIKA